MADQTAIEWTEHTFNPWWGCARVSPGCVHCYADTLASRWGEELWRRHGPRRMMADPYWRKPVKWNRDAQAAGKPAMVFCASMADVFEDHPEPTIRAMQDSARDRLWGLISATPWLTWQLLTKRPENVAAMVPWGNDWPVNVWLGASVEDQRRADERMRPLLGVPARTHFLSCEPLLGPVRLSAWLDPALLCLSGCAGHPAGQKPNCSVACRQLGGTMGTIDWVIAGGESGPKARPMHPDWVESIRDECHAARVPFLFKQWGEYSPMAPLKNGVFDWDRGVIMANDGTVYGKGDLDYPDGPRYGEAIRARHDRAHLTSMYRVGKKAAGRELDGREWNEYPEEASNVG